MTRPDIDAIIKRLRGNCVCVLPSACTSQWCRDLGAVETYIRELELSLKDWKQSYMKLSASAAEMENQNSTLRQFVYNMSEDFREFVRRGF